MVTLEIITVNGETRQVELHSGEGIFLDDGTQIMMVGTPATPNNGSGRRPSNPAQDAAITAAHAAGQTLDSLASTYGISRQSVCAAINREKKRQTVANTATTPSGPYQPTSDDLRTAARLILGKSNRMTADEIRELLKNSL